MILRRENLVSRASSQWRPSTALSGLFLLGTAWCLLGPSEGTRLAKQLVKVTCTPEKWTAGSAGKWMVAVVLKMEIRAVGFPGSLAPRPQSSLSEWPFLKERVLIFLFLPEVSV